MPAPAGLRLDMVEVAADSPLQLELRVEAVMEGVLVTGTVHAALTGECVRCLGPLGQGLTADLTQLWVYEGKDVEDDDLGRLEGDLVDLEPVVRDAVVLALPLHPRCEEGCPGLCEACGTRLADDPTHVHDEPVDPRWAALREFATTSEGRGRRVPTPDEE